MNDDQLRDELERRSNAAPFRADELLPAVRLGIGGGAGRPSRIPSRRLLDFMKRARVRITRDRTRRDR